MVQQSSSSSSSSTTTRKRCVIAGQLFFTIAALLVAYHNLQEVKTSFSSSTATKGGGASGSVTFTRRVSSLDNNNNNNNYGGSKSWPRQLEGGRAAKIMEESPPPPSTTAIPSRPILSPRQNMHPKIRSSKTQKDYEQEQPSLPSTGAAALEILPPASTCLQLRGQQGKWMPSKEGYEYVTNLKEKAGKSARKFRWRNTSNNKGDNFKNETTTTTRRYQPVTMWQWQDQQCPMQLLTPRGFCGVLKQLQIGRVLLVGDSLTYMMTQSLWKLLGNLDDPGDQYIPFNRTFSCATDEEAQEEGGNTTTTTTTTKKKQNHTLVIEYVRNDHLTKSRMKWGCKALCHPWVDTYFSNPTKTLLIANTGLHSAKGEMQEQTQMFENDFDGFVDAITNMDRAGDLVMFRTSVPGHNRCGLQNKPYSNLTQFQQYQSIDSGYLDYGWDKVESFNQYAQHKLSNLSSTDAPLKTGPNWFLLDVYPMTVLRPEGHLPPGDCLHYSLPGPPDWWNHLLHSNLLDIAKLTTTQKQVLDS